MSKRRPGSKHYAGMNQRRWLAVRRAVLRRDNWRCQSCNKPGKLEVHHVKSLADGGDPYALDNLTAICKFCHIDLHRLASATPGRDEWRQFVLELTR